MVFQLSNLADPLPFDQIIDVRSPAEFAEDHVPGAINLPALSNEERATVGTIYVQESRFQARRIGAALVARNVAGYLENELAEMRNGWAPLVYCWRGGQRSGSVATIFRQIGWTAETLDGGYRSYRRVVHDSVYQQDLRQRFVLLDGNTGTAKTALLGLIANKGGQVIDLEGLAEHRGSLFGSLGGGQPSQKAFESRLAGELSRLDPSRPVFLEAESSKIGERIIPPSLWRAMCGAGRIQISATLSDRAKFTVKTYGDVADDGAKLARILDALGPYHCAELIARWKVQATAGELVALVTELFENHYDPRYRKSSADHAERPQAMAAISLATLGEGDLDRAAIQILEAVS